MPLLNGRANVLAGVAGLQSSVDGAVLPVLGGAAWLDDASVLGQSLDGSQLLKVSLAYVAHPVAMASHGANVLVAGGGRWASFLATAPASSVDGSLGQLAGASLYACGADGTIAWKRAYQAASGLVLSAPDGSTTEDPTANLLDVQVLGPGQAIGVTASLQPYAIGVAVPKPALQSRVIRAVTIGSDRWLVCGLQAGGLLVQLDGANEGYILVPIGGNAFRPDARVVNGSIVVCWSTTPGERAQDVQKVTLDLTQPRVALVSQPTGGSVQPGAFQAIQAHPRKLWIAPYFSFSARYGDSPDFATYGNAAVLVEERSTPTDPTTLPATLARVYPKALPLIVDAGVDPSTVKPYVGNIVAWLAAGAHLDDLDLMVRASADALHELPIIAYLDAPEDWPVQMTLEWPMGRVWPAVQAYRRAGESVSDFSARLTALLARVAGYGSSVILTPRWDDLNGSQSVSFTTDCMDVYADLIQQFPICGVMPFADRRGHGISADPDLKAWAQAFARANVGRPNRFDYWTPSTSTPAATLKNKLGQTVEMVVLSASEKQYLLGRLG